MSSKCKGSFVNGKPCNRMAVDRGWCRTHAIPPAYLLADDLADATEAIKCPCKWGDVVSPAQSGDDTTISLSCIDCGTRTQYMELTEPHHIEPIVNAWRNACKAKRMELERTRDGD